MFLIIVHSSETRPAGIEMNSYLRVFPLIIMRPYPYFYCLVTDHSGAGFINFSLIKAPAVP